VLIAFYRNGEYSGQAAGRGGAMAKAEGAGRRQSETIWHSGDPADGCVEGVDAVVGLEILGDRSDATCCT
jgi:hypothetical protein